MNYSAVKSGIFLSRPNRFVAQVQIDGQEERVHVKNTGRCAELLLPGAVVYLEDSNPPQACAQAVNRRSARKTRYDLIAVERKMKEAPPLLINMDSQAPNQVVEEGFAEGRIILPGTEGKKISQIRRERTFGDSRFDLYLEYEDGAAAFVEVKGVTLLESGVARFPDAPTQRGVKHVQELCKVIEAGHLAGLIFVIQIEQAARMEPNWRTHPEFGEALKEAKRHGVSLLAYTCKVRSDFLSIAQPVEVVL